MKKKIIEIEPTNCADKIDWLKMKDHGICGVMIPLGDADYYGRITENRFAESCITAAEEVGLAVGAVVDISCKDPFYAHEAAYNAVEILKRCKAKPALGIAFGLFEKKRSCLIEQGTDGLTDTALALLFESERLGYHSVIYTDFGFADTYMDIKRIKGKRFWGEAHDGWNDKLIIRKISGKDKDYISKLDSFKQNIMV